MLFTLKETFVQILFMTHVDQKEIVICLQSVRMENGDMFLVRVRLFQSSMMQLGIAIHQMK